MNRQTVEDIQPPVSAGSLVLFVSPAVWINHVLAQIVSDLLRDKCQVALILTASFDLLPISVFPSEFPSVLYLKQSSFLQ